MIVVISGGDQVNSSEMGATFQAFPKQEILGLTSSFWIAVALAAMTHSCSDPHPDRARDLRGRRQSGRGAVLRHRCRAGPGAGLRAVRARSRGVAGYLWVAHYGVAYSEIAVGYELTVIAACVIGGISIGGGVGTIPGALLGALFLGTVVNALPTMQVSPFWQMAIAGAVILGSVVLNARGELHGAKLILPEARRKGGTT